MAIRKLVYVDDERLRQQAKKVKQFTSGLKQLAQDMLDTMRAHQGVGLAGPQIGVMQRIFVAEIPLPTDTTLEPHPQSGTSYILVNPEIIKKSHNLVEAQEGCLSIPTWYGLVKRPEWIEVKAQNLAGHWFTLKVDDLLARIFQHEIDHLHGILYTDHITNLEKMWQIVPEATPAQQTDLP